MYVHIGMGTQDIQEHEPEIERRSVEIPAPLKFWSLKQNCKIVQIYQNVQYNYVLCWKTSKTELQK